ncbi:putative T7SS-secreted protein [Streptomyces diastatochromogenes]|uniref:putative T7SS-secreted protein n=1 Tax=Streptomyces diastatochromogenes TaxID=42236 RepID=UPI0036C19472
MSLTGKFNSALGSLKSGYDHVKRTTGHVIDEGAHGVGDALDWAGAHGVADKVDDWGDSTASKLGAHVDEQQLDETEDPKELIHGNPAKLRETAGHLRNFATSFGAVATGMQQLDSSDFKGEAADAFRKKFATHQVKWRQAAEACGEASSALENFAHTVEWAQAQAREAVAKYREGQAASQTHQQKMQTYKDAVEAGKKDPGPKPSEQDPGDEAKHAAEQILDAARRQRTHLATEAADRLKHALQHAPHEPSALNQLKLDGADVLDAAKTEDMRFFGGFMRGLGDLNNLARNANPLDPYAVTHPYEALQAKVELLGGAVHMVTHPTSTADGLWKSFLEDPGGVGGELAPQFLIPEAGAEGVAADGVRVAEDGVKGAEEAAAGEGGAANSARDKVNDDPPATSHDENSTESKGTDPINLATGKMYLPQTDVALPGVLPLILKRRVESGYHLGRWFGPSWSSTLDQRLEIDAEGVVFVTEDGLLLAYPHPAPGLPTLPSHGPRWPLHRVDDGYTVTDPQTHRTWHFADRNENLAVLEQIDDRNGNWITFEYDAEGTPLAVTSSSGQAIRVTTESGRIVAFRLAATSEELKRYGYTDGNLTEVINSSGLPLRFTYDEAGRITSWRDTNDRSYTYEYDDQDRCVAEGGSAGHMTLRLTYGDPDRETGLRTTTATTGEGHTRRYLVNRAWQVVAEIDPLGAATKYHRDRYNRLLSHTNPLGHTTTFRYDGEGNLASVVRPDGRESRAQYNELCLPVKVVNPDGTVVRQTYDEHGNRTSVTDPAGQTTRFTYTEAGHLTSVTDPLGNTTRVVCDRAGLPLEITDPLGATTRYERDALGRPTVITDPTGATALLEWSTEGHLTRRTAPDGTSETWTYDGEGNCTSHTDPMGGVSCFEYTHFDLLTARTGPDGVRYEFDHDMELRLTKVTNPQSLTWTYEYDAAGHLVTETDFDDRTLTYTYDAVGRLASRRNVLGQVVSFERNELGQVTRKDVAGQISTYAYDLTDQLAQATGPDGTTLTLLRDRHGRLHSETVNGRMLSYTYDALGRRTGRTTPSGATSTWSYDAAGRRTGMVASGRPIDFTYDEAGRELSRHIGGTITLDHTFDLLGRLSTQSVTGAAGRTVQHRAYTYRADGNLIGIDDQLSGPRRFDLDAAGRVTAVRAAGWTERYAYDEAGNQAHASWPSDHPGQEAVGIREYTGTRITRAGQVRYEHDALGRVTLRQKNRLSRKPDTWRYAWDAEDRLTSVTTPDGTRWRYTYDPLGRRTAKFHLAEDGETVIERVDFTWDGTTLCEQTATALDLPNAVTLTWDHQGLRPLTQTERITAVDAPQDEIDSRFFAIVTDLVGTPSELIDEQGDIAWRTRSTLWGTTAWASASTAYTPLRFPGQYYDPETGLHYNYFRHYDPETARYLSPDPLGLTPAPNPATYVHNPHRWIDSLGLAPDYPDDGKEKLPTGGDVPGDSRGYSRPDIGRYDYSWSTYDKALAAARERIGDLGADSIKMYDYNPKTGEGTGTLIGERTPDNQRGWRIDNLDGHVNYWDWSTGKKGKGGTYGHDWFPADPSTPGSRHIGWAPWQDNDGNIIPGN